MELLKWELRKIWRPGILAAILLLEAVYYWMFPQFYIEHFCNGPQSEAQFDLASTGWSGMAPPWCGTGCGTPGPCSGPPGGGGPF